ncbi:hypothetical protein GN156_08320 [bacterium LRH843]|nr:hypothetical protein [bacterium LRH843]
MSEQILKQILVKLGSIESEQQHTNQRLANMESDLHVLKETTSRLELKQNLIYVQTGKLSEYHSETKTEEVLIT